MSMEEIIKQIGNRFLSRCDQALEILCKRRWHLFFLCLLQPGLGFAFCLYSLGIDSSQVLVDAGLFFFCTVWVENIIVNIIPMVAGRNNSYFLPVDFGRYFIDGWRIFGGHKTWIGLCSGIIAGSILFSLQYELGLAVFLAFLSTFADLILSFVKRRLHLKPGSLMPVLDHSLYIMLPGIVLCCLFPEMMASVIFFIGLTLFLHPLATLVRFLIGRSDVPW